MSVKGIFRESTDMMVLCGFNAVATPYLNICSLVHHVIGVTICVSLHVDRRPRSKRSYKDGVRDGRKKCRRLRDANNFEHCEDCAQGDVDS